MAVVGPADLEYARPYGSIEHPVLKLQTVVEAYTRVRDFVEVPGGVDDRRSRPAFPAARPSPLVTRHSSPATRYSVLGTRCWHGRAGEAQVWADG